MTTKLKTTRRTFEIILSDGDRWIFDVVINVGHIQRDLDIIEYEHPRTLKALQNRERALQQLFELLKEEGTLIKNEGYFEPNPERR